MQELKNFQFENVKFMHVKFENATGLIALGTYPLNFVNRAGLISACSDADPEVISRVCRQWRSIILSMPLLWSTFYIYGPKKQHESKLALWLERSKTCLLTFQLTESWTADPDILRNILSQLISQVHRWKDAHIYVSTAAQHSLLEIRPGAASSLQSADLHLRDWDVPHADKMWQILHSSSSLTQADWQHLYLGGPPNHAPWAQLTHLFLYHPVTPSMLVDILCSCKQLTELRVWSLIPGSSPPVSSDLLLPHLRLLVMDGYGVDPGLVIDRLTLPSLSHVRVPEKHCTRPSLLNLLIRSRCCLRTFILDEGHITEERILAYLALPEFRSVMHLILRVPLTDKILLALFRREVEHDGRIHVVDFFPKLRTLHIKDLTMPERRLPDGLVAAMVQSRLACDIQRGLSRLQYIEMGYLPDRERHFPCDFLWLMGMGRLNDGLSVVLKTICSSGRRASVMGPMVF